MILVFSTFYFWEILVNNTIAFFLLNLYFLISLINIIHIYHNLQLNQIIKSLELSNKTILNLYDDTRTFKHDFHNIIQAIGGYVCNNDIVGLKQYYTEISNDCKISNNLDKLNYELINNPAIYNILIDKYYTANNNNIEINIDISLDLNTLLYF